MKQDHERRYAIQSYDSYSFYAGVTANSGQVLLGLCCPDLVAFHFDLEGNLLSTEQRPIPCFRGVSPPYDIYDKQLPPLVEAWRQELRLQPATIQVKRFFSDELLIGIQEYPSYFHEILSDSHSDDAEKARIRESIELWDQAGQFVLLWGNDYFLNELGEVVSS